MRLGRAARRLVTPQQVAPLDCTGSTTLLRRTMAAIHLTLCGVIFGWSIVLAIPIPTFPTSQSYRLFAEIATEPHWAMALLAVGLIGLSGIRSHVPLLRYGSTGLLSTTHNLIAGLALAANPGSTGSITYSVLAALGWYLVWTRRYAVF